MEYKYTHEDLKRLNQLPLEEKIALTKLRISEWYDMWGGQVRVSFSGGKDSTVLLKLAREVHPDIKAMFVDTGLEYPEIKAFVKTFDNVDIIRPEMNFKEVLDTYGYVYPNKNIATLIDRKRRGQPFVDKYLDKELYPDSFPIPKAFREHYFLVDSPFKISEKCCDVMKKNPAKKYDKKTGLKGMTATLACESIFRRRSWRLNGCFNTKQGTATPMAFWTGQDVLQYIKQNNVEICSVYGDIVPNKSGGLTTSGEDRTGCLFCPIGLKTKGKPNRIQRLKDSHPKLYDYVLNERGLNMKPFFDFVGIKYE